MTTREEIDVVSCSPALSLSTSDTSSHCHPDLPEDDDEQENNVYLNDNGKNYYCQRCLNHGMHYPRKGHKPNCKFLNCTCNQCIMVEERRRLNNMLSKKKLHQSASADQAATTKGPRIRDPQCARCGAHGVKIPLRGHKRTMCQFATCTCTTCALVENRRTLMAKQIKLRRDQQKGRGVATTTVSVKQRKAPKKVVEDERLRRSGSTTTSTTTYSPSSSTGPTSPLLLPSPLPFPHPSPFPPSAFSPVLPQIILTPQQQYVFIKTIIELQLQQRLQ